MMLSLPRSAALVLGLLLAPALYAQESPEAPVYRDGVLVLTVTTAFDEPDAIPGNGFCSGCALRAAIEEANAQPDAQPVVIEFDIDNGPPGAEIAPGVWKITLDYAPPSLTGSGGALRLPVITQPNVTIDGETQPGASCGDLVTGPKHDLRVVLDGSLLATGGTGIENTADDLTVRGLVVQNFSFSGIRTLGRDELIECNYVGTDHTGETAAGNGSGIQITSSFNATVQNNVVSANAGAGISISSSSGTLLARNLVGSDADGDEPLGNSVGISLSSSDGVTLTTNLASGNTTDGINIERDAGGAVLTNNTVGLNRLRTTALGNGSDGILVEGPGNDIGLPGAGNFVGGNSGSGVRVGADLNRIRGNTIGLSRLGEALPNLSEGIYVADRTSQTTIGGPAPGEGNIVSGNGADGITLDFDSATTLIEGNTIGLNADGDARPNGTNSPDAYSGIFLRESIDPVIRGNTVSGNAGVGIRFSTSTQRTEGRGDEALQNEGAQRSSGPIIENNAIGTTPDGTAARPNGLSGLVLTNGAGFASVIGNTISGNTDTGVFLTGGAGNIVLENNFIGTNANGDDLGNGLAGGDGRAGIFCQDAAGVRIGQNFSPNTIAFNDTDGIFLSPDCQTISIVGNIIYANGGLAVDLAPNGPNPNDPGDGDTGANSKQNYPVITSAENDGTNAIITWTLDAEPNKSYELLFCRTDTPDPSGYGECPDPNALATVVTGGAGNASGTKTLGPGLYPAGSFVTVNASEIGGQINNGYRATSEFSATVQVADTRPAGVFLSATNITPLTVAPGGSISFDYTVTNTTGAVVSGDLFFTASPGGASGLILSGTVPAGQTASSSFTQNVPGAVPLGSYTYTLRVGQFPGVTVDAEAFTVTVADILNGVGEGDTWSVRDAGPWTLAAEPEEAARSEADGSAARGTLPGEATLAGAYPNPFVRSATIAFALPEAQRVSLVVYDVLGREVRRLVDGHVEAGRHETILDGSALLSGVYVVRMEAGSFSTTRRLVLTR